METDIGRTSFSTSQGGWYVYKSNFQFPSKFSVYWDATYDNTNNANYMGLLYAGFDNHGYVLQQNKHSSTDSDISNNFSAIIPNKSNTNWSPTYTNSNYFFSDTLTGGGRYRCLAIIDIANLTTTTWMTKDGQNEESLTNSFSSSQINTSDTIEALTFGVQSATQSTGIGPACCNPAIGMTLNSAGFWYREFDTAHRTALLTGEYNKGNSKLFLDLWQNINFIATQTSIPPLPKQPEADKEGEFAD